MKKIFLVICSIFILSCTSAEKEKTLTIDNMEVPYSMVEQSIDLDDSMSLSLFLESGFNPNYTDDKGETILMKIVKNNGVKTLKTLIIYHPNLEIETPKRKRENTNSYLPTRRSIDFVRNEEILNILIDSGVDINYINNLGTPLIINYIKTKPNSYIKKLIDKKVKLEVLDRDQWTPLMWATGKQNDKIVSILISSGVNINKVDKRGNTAIFYAYSEKTIVASITKKIRKDIKNNSGENILGEVYLRSISNSYYDAVEKLVEVGVDINYSSYGDIPLDIAKRNKDEKMVKLLKKLGVEE